MTSRSIGLSLLLGVAACTPGYNRPETRATLVPQNGPRARVSATQYGGLTQRTVRTSFRADKNAHVLVGRLGGDGRIEILFPESPRASTLVAGGKTYSVPTFAAPYDGVPQLYRYASQIYRTHSARMDSYDGLGHGFIFAIASEFPINTDALDDHGVWSDSLEVEDYYALSDPRMAIRDFATVLTSGLPYSLDYAGALSTYAFGSMAHSAWDCAAMVSVLGNVGMLDALRMMNFGMGFGMGFGSAGFMSGFGYSPYAGCGFGYDRRMAYGYNRWSSFGSWGWDRSGGVYYPWNTTTPTTNPLPSKVAFTSGERRPGRLAVDEEGAGINLARPRFGGSKPTVTSSASTITQSRPRYEGRREKPTVQEWAPAIRETRVPYDRSNRPVLHSTGSSGNSGSSGSSGSFGGSGSSGTSSGSSSPAPAPAASAPRASGSQGPGRISPKDPQ